MYLFLSINQYLKFACTFDVAIQIQCSISRLVKSSPAGKPEVKNPKCLGAAVGAVVLIDTERSVTVEPFVDCAALGRFALRAKGQTTAVGICLKIY